MLYVCMRAFVTRRSYSLSSHDRVRARIAKPKRCYCSLLQNNVRKSQLNTPKHFFDVRLHFASFFGVSIRRFVALYRDSKDALYADTPTNKSPADSRL